MKTRKLIAVLLILALCLPALALGEPTAVTAVDMMGRELTLSAPATRVVALTAADCEILCAIGAGDALVGRGEYCDYPAEVLEVPSVQSGYETNIEQIIALEPQLVLMSSMAQTKEGVEALEGAGVTVAVSEATDIAGVYEAIGMIGALTGRDAQAAALAEEMRAAFAALGAEAANDGKTVYFEVSPLEYGLWTAGAHTFMDELAAMAGLTNAFADVEGWAEISAEQVIARDPDYIVTISMSYGDGPSPEEEIMARDGWQDVKAVKNKHVLAADSNELTRPGPRLVDAARKLCDYVKE